MYKKDIQNTILTVVKVNLNTKPFLKAPISIIRFFKSSIGPKIKKAATPQNE